MKTIYFPHTYLDSRQAKEMAALWGPLTLLQPSPEIDWAGAAPLQAAGLIERVSVPDDPPQPLHDILQALQQWALQHSGGDLATMIEQGREIPYFPDHASSRIVAEIRKGGREKAGRTTADPSEKRFRAQLLLAMAQAFDRQQAELAREIKTLAAQEDEMMALLKGEPVFAAHTSRAVWTPAGDVPDLQISLRLKAWARLMAAVIALEGFPGAVSETLFLTPCREVLAQVKELFPEAQTRLQFTCPASPSAALQEITSLPAWLAERLGTGIREIGAEGGGLPAECDLIEIPDVPCEAFLRRLANPTHPKRSDRSTPPGSESCWMACMVLSDDAGGGMGEVAGMPATK
ncbi:MAG: hypothetical protein PVJ53_03800 [Desulfobacterales bacterium]|jgi:hypothetical protein